MSRTSAASMYGTDIKIPVGRLFLQGSTSQTSALEIHNVEKVETNPTGIARPVMVRIAETVAPVASGSFIDYHALDVNMVGSSANINVNTGFYAIEGTVAPSAASIGKGVGVYGHGQYNGSGTAVEIYGFQALVANSSSGTISNAAGLLIRTNVNDGGGVITNNYGLKIEDQTVGANDWAIKTGLGTVEFGDVVIGPTAAVGTNTTQLATTAFVLANGKGYTLLVQALGVSVNDAETDYFGMIPSQWTSSGGVGRKVYIRKAGTIKIAELYSWSPTAGTGEAWSMYIRLNNTTDTLIQTVSVAASERIWTNSSLSVAVVAGDYFEIKSIAPTFATNPVNTVIGGYIYIE